MSRAEMIAILTRYSAFFTKGVRLDDKHVAHIVYNWKYDTAFAYRPVFTEDNMFWDYSPLMDLQIDCNNYKSFLKDPLAYARCVHISKLSTEKGEKLMYRAMLAQEKFSTMINKAKLIKSIIEEA